MDDDDKDGDNGNRKNNGVDNGDENEDEGKLNVFLLGLLPFLIKMVMKTGQTHCGRRQ